jgi:hypothetical protein
MDGLGYTIIWAEVDTAECKRGLLCSDAIDKRRESSDDSGYKTKNPEYTPPLAITPIYTLIGSIKDKTEEPKQCPARGNSAVRLYSIYIRTSLLPVRFKSKRMYKWHSGTEVAPSFWIMTWHDRDLPSMLGKVDSYICHCMPRTLFTALPHFVHRCRV